MTERSAPVPLKPPKEVVGIAGKKRHSAGRYIEQVIRLTSAEGEPRTDTGARFDNRNVERSSRVEEVERNGSSA
jgi:hypothetical protein